MRTKVLIVILINLLSFAALKATEITPQTATTVAKNFFSAQTQAAARNIQIKQTFTYHNSKGIAVYIITFQDGGYVMVSGDDSMQPIIGYGLKGEVPTLSEKKDLHPMLQTKLDGTRTKQQLRRVAIDPAKQALWTSLREGTYTKGTNPLHRNNTNVSVAPLVETLWKQGYPYNKEFPALDGTTTLTGCMPTAVAQIMKYHNHPAQGVGSTSHYWDRGNQVLDVDYSTRTYNWSAMPNELLSSSSNTSKSAISNLMYDIAIGIQADFGRDEDGGTFASAIYIEDALEDFFGYKSSMYAAARAAYTTNEWRNMIVAELDAARPVLYTGQDGSVGHAFVCDGYDFSNDYFFHINWGWGGIQNGYFLLENLDTGEYVWNDNTLVIVGIQPDPNVVAPTEPPVVQKADLVIEQISASSTSILPGESIVFNSVVKNIGNVQCELSSRVKYYISSDNVKSDDDIYVGYDYVGKLNVGATSNETISITFENDLGTGEYFILLLADGTGRVDELNEDNVFAVAITVNGVTTPTTPLLADLVPDYSELNQESAEAGTFVYAYSELSNLGTVKSPKSYMRYYLSTDQEWNVGDKYLGYDAVGGIEPGAWGWEEVNFKIPASTTPGDYYVLFVADASDKVEESDEDNNVRSEAITVTDGSPRLATSENPSLGVNVFPNPVTDYVMFTYTVETAGKVSVQIFDLQGKLVKTLVSQYQAKGDYQTRWSDSILHMLPSGIYVARIEVGEIVETVKLMK